ncbi:hypothetical protein BGZ58_004882, partial [Dissophora ornata]
MAKDPVGAISRVGRMEAFQFNNTTAGDIFRSRDKIRANVNQLGPKNSMTITQVYPRKLAVIVKLLHVNFLLEIESACVLPTVTRVVDVGRRKDAFAEIAQRLSHYKPEDIYNCYETGLYLKLLRNRSLTTSKKGHSSRLCNRVAAHQPRGLDNALHPRFKFHFRGSGYMTSVLFLEWLTGLDTQMEEAGRKIVLVMDNAPGKYNFNLATAGCRDYSRHMVRVISQHCQQAETDDIKVPNAEFYKCVADTWDDATVATMRNCFAHVPSSPENQDSDNDDKPSPDEAQEDSQEGGQKEPEQRVSQRTLVLHLLANIQSSVEKLRTLATDPEAEDDFIVPATLTSLDAICKRVDLLDDLVAF